jgi:hypothetical protein
MNKLNTNLFLLTIFIFLFSDKCFCLDLKDASEEINKNNNVLFLNFSKIRPLAMGGAFISVQDDIPSIGYNPAAFELYNFSEDRYKITLFLNPVVPLLRVYQLYESRNKNIQQWGEGVASFVKGIFFSRNSFETGVVIAEGNVDDGSINLKGNFKRTLFRANDNFFLNNSSNFIVKLKLADKVMLGVTGSFIAYSGGKENKKRKFARGVSYGILLKPSDKYSVGVSYIDVQDRIPNYRNKLDRIGDETLNVGISFYPFPWFILSFDVRNTTEEKNKLTSQKVAAREFHFGLELNPFSQLSIRGGYFRETPQLKNNVFSFGVGFLDLNAFRNSGNKIAHQNLLFNYAFILETQHNTKWHLLYLNITLN